MTPLPTRSPTACPYEGTAQTGNAGIVSQFTTQLMVGSLRQEVVDKEETEKQQIKEGKTSGQEKVISELFGIVRAELDNPFRQIEPNATNVDYGGNLVILPTLNPEHGPHHDFNDMSPDYAPRAAYEPPPRPRGGHRVVPSDLPKYGRHL